MKKKDKRQGTYLFHGKALSVAQPWASAIAYAGKNIENRSKRIRFRGPIAIHASGTLFKQYVSSLRRQVRGGPRKPLIDWIKQGQRKLKISKEEQGVVQSHILAIAMVTGCVERSGSPWFGGDAYGWCLDAVVPIEPIASATGSISGMTGGIRSTSNQSKKKYQPARSRKLRSGSAKARRSTLRKISGSEH